MNHQYLTGKVYHQRFAPKQHFFEYPFFMIDIDPNQLVSLKNILFGNNTKNVFSFHTQDHFGKTLNFLENIQEVIKRIATQTLSKDAVYHFT